MKKRIIKADDERLFIVAEAIRQGVTKEEINEWCEMDFFFLQKVENIVNMEREVKANVGNMEVLQTAKKWASAITTSQQLGTKRSAKFTICVKKII